MQLVIQGEQPLKLTAEETAMVLDTLATQPYNRVQGLIAKIMQQVALNMAPKPDVKDA